MVIFRFLLVFVFAHAFSSLHGYGADGLQMLLQTSSTDGQTQADLSWMSASESFYEVLSATNIAGPWAAANAAPLAATNLVGKMQMLSMDRTRFFKVRELDTKGPVIQSRYPLNGMVGIGRLAPIEVTLGDENGIQTNAFRLIVNGTALLPANYANTRVTTNSFTYMPTIAWGDYGTTVTVSFVCFDTKNNSTVESWSFSLEEPVSVADNVLVVGGSASASGLLPTSIKLISSDLALIEIASNRVVFSYSGAAHGITPGMLLVNDDFEHLFYRRVTSLEEDNSLNRLTVYTTDVPLTELITSGTFESSQFEWVAPGSGVASAIEITRPQTAATALLDNSISTFPLNLNFPVTAVHSFENNVTFDGTCEFGLHGAMWFSLNIRNGKIDFLGVWQTDSFDAQINGVFTIAAATAGMSAKIADLISEQSLSAPIELGSMRTYFGGVPVSLSVLLNGVDVYVEAATDRGVSADLNVSQHTGCSVAFVRKGNVSSPVCEYFQAPYLQQTVAARKGFNGDLHIYLKPRLTARFHGIADVALAMERGPELSGSWLASQDQYLYRLFDRHNLISELIPVNPDLFYGSAPQQAWSLLDNTIPLNVWLWPNAVNSQPLMFTLHPVGVTAPQDTTVVLSACAVGSPAQATNGIRTAISSPEKPRQS